MKDVKFLPISKVKKIVPYGFFKSFFLLLAYLRIISLATEDKYSSDYKLNLRRGILPGITLARKTCFQHSDFINNHLYPPLFKSTIKSHTLRWIKSKVVAYKSRNLVFVHIRRGDYLFWPSHDSPAVLPLSWYNNAIEKVKATIYNPLFVIISDDLEYVRQHFHESESIIFSNNSLEVDLYLMSLCTAGILSASTFAWWGAYYAKMDSPMNSLFIAPKYWAGHRNENWFPPNYKCSWLTYM